MSKICQVFDNVGYSYSFDMYPPHKRRQETHKKSFSVHAHLEKQCFRISKGDFAVEAECVHPVFLFTLLKFLFTEEKSAFDVEMKEVVKSELVAQLNFHLVRMPISFITLPLSERSLSSVCTTII